MDGMAEIETNEARQALFVGEGSMTNRAISLAGLRHFIRKHCITDDMPTWKVVEEYIKPATAEAGTAYTALLATKCDKGGTPFLGIANYFISHSWGSNFMNLVDVVAQVTHTAISAGDAVPYIWFDIIAINQHNPGDIAMCLDRLDRPIAHSGKLLLVLDPWRKPAALSRVWCLLEIMKAIKLEAKIIMRMPQASQREFFQAVTKNHGEVEKLLTSAHVADAQATVETDKWAIFAKIQRQLGASARVSPHTLFFISGTISLSVIDL